MDSLEESLNPAMLEIFGDERAAFALLGGLIGIVSGVSIGFFNHYLWTFKQREDRKEHLKSAISALLIALNEIRQRLLLDNKKTDEFPLAACIEYASRYFEDPELRKIFMWTHSGVISLYHLPPKPHTDVATAEAAGYRETDLLAGLRHARDIFHGEIQERMDALQSILSRMS